jgi:hypothetical protein
MASRTYQISVPVGTSFLPISRVIKIVMRRRGVSRLSLNDSTPVMRVLRHRPSGIRSSSAVPTRIRKSVSDFSGTRTRPRPWIEKVLSTFARNSMLFPKAAERTKEVNHKETAQHPYRLRWFRECPLTVVLLPVATGSFDYVRLAPHSAQDDRFMKKSAIVKSRPGADRRENHREAQSTER